MPRYVVTAPILMLVAVAGCQSPNPAPIDEPAVLAPDSGAASDEIAAILRAALRDERIRLSDSFFTESSVLLIERSVRGNLQDLNPLGRNLDMPERFTLVVNGQRCELIRQRTGERWLLQQARCIRHTR